MGVRYRVQLKAHRVAERLHSLYGSPRHDNKDDPLDELVFIILSQMTTRWSFGRVYDRLKARFPSWEMLLALRPAAVRALIKDAGLSNQKGPRLLEIFRRLKADFGKVSLDALREMCDADAERYLTTLPGVGIKTAKCVLMYSLGRDVLPVDTHVWRVARRLGLVLSGLPYTKVHDALEAAVVPGKRYTFHVNAISHGREVCLPRNPRCSACALRLTCAYYRSGGRAAARRSPRP